MNGTVVTCDRCHRKFSSYAAMLQHYKAKHPNVANLSELKNKVATEKETRSLYKASVRSRGPSHMKLVAFVFIVVVAFAVIGYVALTPREQTSKRVAVGTVAPDFSLPAVGQNGLTGETVTLSSFRGKVVLLEFMVPWCEHCQNMAPVLEDLYQRLGPQNVVFLSVSGPWQGASANDAANFIRNYGSSWIYVYDSSNSVFSLYGVDSTPTFFVISKNSTVTHTYNGEVPSETLAADLTRINS